MAVQRNVALLGIFCVILHFVVVIIVNPAVVIAAPKSHTRTYRQLRIRPPSVERNPDGSVSGSFGFANALNLPGISSAFADSTSFTIGPKGVSFANSGSSSMDSGLPGFKSGFSQSNANAFGGGLGGISSASANAMAASLDNPFLSSIGNTNTDPFSSNRRINPLFR